MNSYENLLYGYKEDWKMRAFFTTYKLHKLNHDKNSKVMEDVFRCTREDCVKYQNLLELEKRAFNV